MGMAYRDRQGVRCIIWPGSLVESENKSHHLLNLRLVGLAVASDRELDFRRSVFDDRNTVLRRGEQDNSASLPDTDCRRHISSEIELLNGDDSGIMLLDQTSDLSVQMEQSPRHLLLGRSFDNAMVEPMNIAIEADGAIAETCGSRIDSENDLRDFLRRDLAHLGKHFIRNVDV
jgi:hypothetical protein